MFDGLEYYQFGSDGENGPIYTDLETAKTFFRGEHGDNAAVMVASIEKLQAKIASGNIKFADEEPARNG
tara:strand:- start:275 stop:481 length:207 start_codon:yes stop_codon:yes gene_type:complete